jgi:hypothetical protein
MEKAMQYKTRNPRFYYVSDEYAVGLLVEFYVRHGRFPALSFKDGCKWREEDRQLCIELKIPSIVNYIKYLGSYNTACKMAADKLGIEFSPHKRGTKQGDTFYSEEYLIELWRFIKQETGDFPRLSGGKKGEGSRKWHFRFSKYPLPNPNTIYKRYGSYTKFLERVE